MWGTRQRREGLCPCGAGQLVVGGSIESTTRTSTGSLDGTSFSPNCSSSAVNTEGLPVSSVAARAAGAYSSVKSYLPVKLVLSTTGLPVSLPRRKVRLVSGASTHFTFPLGAPNCEVVCS